MLYRYGTASWVLYEAGIVAKPQQVYPRRCNDHQCLHKDSHTHRRRYALNAYSHAQRRDNIGVESSRYPQRQT